MAEPKLVNMQLTATERKEMTEPSTAHAPRYPWGLNLTLDNEALEKLKLDGALPDVGASLTLVATVKVTGVSANDHEHGKHRSVNLQITSMALEGREKKKAADVLFGG